MRMGNQCIPVGDPLGMVMLLDMIPRLGVTNGRHDPSLRRRCRQGRQNALILFL